MSAACRICLKELGAENRYHRSCLKTLFHAARLPRIELELAKFHTAALAMVGHTSISGVQKKISVTLSADKATLQIAIEGGRYILKPRGETFPNLPENEHVTMRIAARAGIDVPPCGLLPLADDSLAYIVARFDRPASGGKLHLEDFCQLAGKSPKKKYDGSAELCARLVMRYASEPGVDLLRLYRRVLFSWWTGNGDMHLKNFSLLTDGEGFHRLSPAYDLLCSRLVIGGDQLALPVRERRAGLNRDNWFAFAEYCQLRRPAAERVHAGLVESTPEALAIIDRSLLPDEMKSEYQALLRERSHTLAG